MHLGQTFGATPNPNATRPATIAAIGNPYGGMQGPAIAPHGVVGSTGIGNGLKSGSNAGTSGQGCLGGNSGRSRYGNAGKYGKVASAGIPAATSAAVAKNKIAPRYNDEIEVLSKPPVQYTGEARQLHVQGDVVLSVTFLASGRVVVNGVIHGLGHGLDEEARRVAEQIRFRPATSNGRPVDVTTKIHHHVSVGVAYDWVASRCKDLKWAELAAAQGAEEKEESRQRKQEYYMTFRKIPLTFLVLTIGVSCSYAKKQPKYEQARQLTAEQPH